MSNNKQVGLTKYDSNMRDNESVGDGLVWHSPLEEPFQIAGLAWFQEERMYRRMPSHPDYPLPEAVNYLAGYPAGGQIRFQTDSASLSVRVKLKEPANMPHMPATGQCGVDCYVGPPGEMEFCNTAKYVLNKIEYESDMFKDCDKVMRNMVLNMPLYQGVEEIWIGLEQGASIIAPPEYASDKKVVIYGTSITQGGCASRPGMAYTNILSRRIPLEFINLGFSGSGKGEPEVARVISQIQQPACLVLDYEANCVSTELYRETLPAFIQIYREAHPKTPIIVISRIRFARENMTSLMLDGREERKQFQQQLVAELRAGGDEFIYFFDGSELLGQEDFHECTVDGIHPTDLGFLRMANGLEPMFRTLLL